MKVSLIKFIQEFIVVVGSSGKFFFSKYLVGHDMMYMTWSLINRIKVDFYYSSYELLFIARVTSYFLDTSYELLLIARVTS